MRARCAGGRLHGEVGQVSGAWHRVVHVRTGQELAALGVVDALFEHRLTQTLANAAMYLAFHDHRVDHVAEVIHSGELDHVRLAGIGIDLDFADVRAGRIREVRWIVERVLVQAWLELVEWVVVRHVRRQRHLAKRLGAIGAGHAEHAVLELDVGVGCLEQVRGDLLGLGLDLVECFHDRRAAHCQ